MDPLLLFPPEVVHQIWVHLKPKDLLACRAVASHWLESVTSCDEAWFTEFSYDWHEYFEMKKTLRRWSSGKVRRNTFTEVKDCVFSEVAFYLLFLDGRLEMHSPSGKLVRVFEKKATDLHEGNNCLMIGVDNDQKSGVNTGHDTFITDFVLNEIESLIDISVTFASPKGFAYIENRKRGRFCEFANRTIELRMNYTGLHFLDTCIVAFTDCERTIAIYCLDAEKPRPYFMLVKRFIYRYRSSLMSMSHREPVKIVPGPRNYYGVQHYNDTVSVYFKRIWICKVTDSYFSFFTKDFLVTQPYDFSYADIFEVKHFDERVRQCDGEEDSWLVEPLYEGDGVDDLPWGDPEPLTLRKSKDSVRNIISSNPCFTNCVIHFYNTSSHQIFFGSGGPRLPGPPSVMVVVAKLLDFPTPLPVLEEFAPTLELKHFASALPCLAFYVFLPKYAFLMETREDLEENEFRDHTKVVTLIHFDL